jgi:uncharacterized protein YjiS (DUF1127 family)
MTVTRSNTGLDVVLDTGRSIFHQGRDQIRQALAKRSVYRRTFSELAALTDRDLKDLGIPRSNIRRLAMEAAYDH